MRPERKILIAAVSILCAATGLAHHGLETQFDLSKPVTLDGTVTKILWVNPHVHFYIDVKDEHGAVANWEIDMGSANDQMLRGWKIDTFRQGDRVTVTAYRAKDGSNLAFGKKITRP